MGVNFFDAAADLVSLGLRVFPLVPSRKLPLIKAWQNVATDDAEEIAAWAEQWPTANIGIATGTKSGVIVIDIDRKDGKDGLVALDGLAKQGEVLPPSPIAITPTGGQHRYFRAVAGIRNAMEVARDGRGLGRGIDVRADGGFVVAPPSVLIDCAAHGAGQYCWRVPPMTSEFPRLPEWAVKRLSPQPTPPRQPVPIPSPIEAEGYRRQALSDLHELTAMMSSLKDGRHQAPFSMACRIGKYQAHGFLTEAEIERAFLNASANNGALSKYAIHDLTSQVRNGLRRAKADGLPPLASVHRASTRRTA